MGSVREALVAGTVALALGLTPAACGQRGGGGGGGGGDRDTGPGGMCTGTCEECVSCAQSSAACLPARDACMASMDCPAFVICAGETDDPVRIEMCRTMHPEGASLYCTYFDCAFSDQCGASCTEPAVICPR